MQVSGLWPRLRFEYGLSAVFYSLHHTQSRFCVPLALDSLGVAGTSCPVAIFRKGFRNASMRAAPPIAGQTTILILDASTVDPRLRSTCPQQVANSR
jgi:hypothetical protein